MREIRCFRVIFKSVFVKAVPKIQNAWILGIVTKKPSKHIFDNRFNTKNVQVVFWLCLGFLILCGKNAPFAEMQFLRTKVELDSWGVEDPREINHGRLHIIHQTGHDRLKITSLLGESPTLQLKTAAKPRIQEIPSLKIVSPLSMRNVNLFGGRHSTFTHPPSSAKLERFSDGVGYQSLAFNYDNQASGFCGLWMHLFDSTQDIAKIQPFDASQFAYLTFWVKGSQGGESIWVKAADVNWLQKDDALPIGQMDSYLPAGQITQEWQQAAIPLTEFPDRLAAHELATLVFQPKGYHAGTVELRGIAFCDDPQTAKEHTNPFHDTLTSNKAMWIWNTVDFLRDKKERQELKAVLQKHGFDTVFIQVPFGPNLKLDRGRLADLIAALKQDGISVHALDGAPEFALPENHDHVKRIVKRIILFNQTVPEASRFDAIHLDIEPYLLPGFNGYRRYDISYNYLDLLTQLSTLCQFTDLPFGVDIPFWYDTRDTHTGKKHSLMFNGRTKLLSEHILDIVDFVAIMNYRTEIEGEAGLITFGRDEIAYAATQAKRVYIGIETMDLPDETIVDFAGQASLDPSKIDTEWFVAITTRESGGVIYILPKTEWESFHAKRHEEGLEDIYYWPVTRSFPLPATKLSFARLGFDRLQRGVLEITTRWQDQPSFAGVAIHDYQSYANLLTRFISK